MSLETSKKILKIFGIIGIVFGIIALIVGILAVIGGGLIGVSDPGNEDAVTVGALGIVGGIFAVVSALITLLQGIFSVRAAKDSTKIMPAWIFALLGLISNVISLISSFGNGGSAIVSAIISLAISILIFVAANTIKKSNG